MLSFVVFSLVVVGICLALVFLVFPLVLAISQLQKNGARSFRNSKLYVGQVWHTRFQPKLHGFTYPIFMFVLDLEEDFGDFMSPVVRFRESDHLKNGEELLLRATGENKHQENSLAERILRLVCTKTKGKCQPILESHRVMLLTHLCYYGYNFNPVSFYYVVCKKTNQITAMVGEVSNTPWTEMYCYVLHPDSVDQVQTKTKGSSERQRVEYIFPKQFHVSPFMDMDFWYDWVFVGVPGSNKNNSSPDSSSSSLTVLNNLRRRSNDQTEFKAKLTLTAQTITPFNVAWQMIRFPIFCMIIQVWIHYQALWLFLKGVVYVPHPEEAETAASKVIASIMTPFFAIRDFISPKSKTA